MKRIKVFVSWIIYLLFLLWQILVFIGMLYRFYKGAWVKEMLKDKISRL